MALNPRALLDVPFDLLPLSARCTCGASAPALCRKFDPAVPVVDVWLRMLLGWSSPLLSVSSSSCLCPQWRFLWSPCSDRRLVHFGDHGVAVWRAGGLCSSVYIAVSEACCGRPMPTVCACACLQPSLCFTSASLSLLCSYN